MNNNSEPRIADLFIVWNADTGTEISAEDNFEYALGVAIAARADGVNVVVYFPGQVIDE